MMHYLSSLFVWLSVLLILFFLILFVWNLNSSTDWNISYKNDNSIVFPKPKSEPVRIAFVGDIMLDRGIRNIVDIHGLGDYGYITKYLEFLQDFDLVFGNLEGPVSDKGFNQGSIYSFRMNPVSLEALLGANISVLSVANNHAGDWGVDAFADSLVRLRDSGILYVGGGINLSDAKSLKVFEKNGLKIGFLGFSDVGPKWMEVQENFPGILIAESSYRDDLIQRSSGEVDFLVVSYHYGEEYQELPNERQRFLSMRSIDLGADIVVGHHPHVIQPVEEYLDGVIAYSLGNFIFDQYFSSETMEGLVLVVEIEGEDISYYTKEVELTRHFQPQLRIDSKKITE